jgi:integrin alpha FG-GAP repeat containing protein 1
MNLMPPQIDVFLLCDNGHGGNTYQIWVNNKADGFSLALQGPMPSGVRSVSFADVGMSYKFLTSNS